MKRMLLAGLLQVMVQATLHAQSPSRDVLLPPNNETISFLPGHEAVAPAAGEDRPSLIGHW